MNDKDLQELARQLIITSKEVLTSDNPEAIAMLTREQRSLSLQALDEINELCHRSEKSVNKSHKHENRRNIEQSKRCYKQFRNQKYFRK